ESVPRVTDQHAVLDRTHADVSALEGCTDEIFHHVEVRIPAESKKLRFRECFVFAITRRGEDRPDGERSSRDPAKPETEMPVQAGHDERVYRADVSPATGRFAKIGKSSHWLGRDDKHRKRCRVQLQIDHRRLTPQLVR